MRDPSLRGGRAAICSAAGFAVVLLCALVAAGSASALPINCLDDGINVTCTYSAVDAEQTFDVPASVTAVTISAYGAAGTGTYASPGGPEGTASATVSVTPLSTLYVEVGGSDGWNGGGGGPGTISGAPGGGASDVRTVSCGVTCYLGGDADSLASRLVVAGGGGGSGGPGSFGASLTPGGSGGASGNNGGTANNPFGGSGGGGGGGNGSAGGGGGSGSDGGADGSSGALGVGGNPGSGAGADGGGGGGGYYGGGGGGGGGGGLFCPIIFVCFPTLEAGGGGGGGSSYAPGGSTDIGDPSLPASVTITYLAHPTAPSNTSPPSVSGSIYEGLTLTGDVGSWTGGPAPTITQQWLRCTGTGGGCTAIPGATGTDYTTTPDDVHHALRFRVTATNSFGTATLSSPLTGLIAVQKPINTAPSSVSGSTVEGMTLTGDPGGWDGSPATFTYQWLRCTGAGTGCTAIPGGTDTDYATTLDDVHHTLKFSVTAANSAGTTVVLSAQTGLVAVQKPVNTAQPSISGSTFDGLGLTGDPGGWDGSPATFTYQWLRCTGAGTGCVAIPGATSTGYTTTTDDVHHTLKFSVSAANSAGTTIAASPPTGLIAVQKPINTSPPSVSGSTFDGLGLTGDPGGWDGSPATVTYQWLRCTGAGTGCVAIPGATSTGYTTTTDDVHHTLKFSVTASNSAGSTTTSSQQTLLIAVQKPIVTAAPAITGSTVEGTTLIGDLGSWIGSPASFTYQWLRCTGAGTGCVAIPGATGTGYTTTLDDVHHTLKFSVTASNSAGSTTISSSQTGLIAVQKPTATIPPTISGSTNVGSTLSGNLGIWSGSPTSVTAQWWRCTGAGGGCVPIPAATTTIYTTTADDVHHTLKFAVTASNSAGSTTATSTQTGLITGF